MATFKLSTETSKSLSAKRLCTSDNLSRKILEVSANRFRILPYRADVETRHSTMNSATKSLVSDYMFQFWSWLDGRRFLTKIVMGKSPFVTIRNSCQNTALGGWNRRLACRLCRRLQSMHMSVDLGSSVADMSFVQSESGLPYTQTLCNVLKQASARKSFENVLWVNAMLHSGKREVCKTSFSQFSRVHAQVRNALWVLLSIFSALANH